jgi:hypothetical protein
MEHVTAVVDHDATTPITCGCARLAAAGWRVNCAACGRSEFDAGELGVTVMAAEYSVDVVVDDDPVYGVGGELESTLEAYDVARDDRLVDPAERAVA